MDQTNQTTAQENAQDRAESDAILAGIEDLLRKADACTRQMDGWVSPPFAIWATGGTGRAFIEFAVGDQPSDAADLEVQAALMGVAEHAPAWMQFSYGFTRRYDPASQTFVLVAGVTIEVRPGSPLRGGVTMWRFQLLRMASLLSAALDYRDTTLTTDSEVMVIAARKPQENGVNQRPTTTTPPAPVGRDETPVVATGG